MTALLSNGELGEDVLNKLNDIIAQVNDLANVADYADDVAAAAAGVQIGGFYRTASVLKIRVL